MIRSIDLYEPGILDLGLKIGPLPADKKTKSHRTQQNASGWEPVHSVEPRAMPVLGDCTACSGEALDDASGCAHIHPKLGVLLCERCFGRATREFEVDVRHRLPLPRAPAQPHQAALHAQLPCNLPRLLLWQPAALRRMMGTRHSAGGAAWAATLSAATTASALTVSPASSATWARRS